MVKGRERGREERESFLLHCSRDISHDIRDVVSSLSLSISIYGKLQNHHIIIQKLK